MLNANAAVAEGTAQAVPQYLDRRAIAALFGISPRTVDVWMHKRLIPFLKIGKTVRFDPADVREHLATRCRVCSVGIGGAMSAPC